MDFGIVIRWEILKDWLEGPWQNWTGNYYAEACFPILQKNKKKWLILISINGYHCCLFPILRKRITSISMDRNIQRCEFHELLNQDAPIKRGNWCFRLHPQYFLSTLIFQMGQVYTTDCHMIFWAGWYLIAEVLG